MTKFHAPQMSVIRFNESDVIVASNGLGKTLTILGYGNTEPGDATFTIGNGDPWTSSQVYGNSAFTTAVNDFLGGNYFSNNNEIYMGYIDSSGNAHSQTIDNIAYNDINGDEKKAIRTRLNGVFTWNSFTNRFEIQ